MIINPDIEFVKEIREEIKKNDGYCCCELLKTEDLKCPCYNMRINKICECGLYINESEEEL